MGARLNCYLYQSVRQVLVLFIAASQYCAGVGTVCIHGRSTQPLLVLRHSDILQDVRRSTAADALHRGVPRVLSSLLNITHAVKCLVA